MLKWYHPLQSASQYTNQETIDSPAFFLILLLTVRQSRSYRDRYNQDKYCSLLGMSKNGPAHTTYKSLHIQAKMIFNRASKEFHYNPNES